MRSLGWLAVAGIACLPCLAIGVAALGGAISAVGGTLLSPEIGIPLAVAGASLITAGGWWLWRRRHCDFPEPGGRPAAPIAKERRTNA